MNSRVPFYFTVLALAAGALRTQEPTGGSEAKAQAQALRAAGTRTPLVLHPIRVLGRPSAQVAEALGLVLEAQGMPDLDVAHRAFDVPKDTRWGDVPALFGGHVAAAGGDGAKKHHLYAEFLGTPETGPEEVRFVVVDGAGHVVLVDRQTPADTDFRRTAAKDPDPLGCATLVADRLFTLAGWKQAPGSVREGKFARAWKERSGVPDKAALAAMKARLTSLRANLAGTRIAVLPTLAAGGHDAASATRLAGELTKNLGCSVVALPDGALLTVAPNSNEQKRLWDLARALSTSLSQSVVTADHALVADLGVDAAGGHAYVHVVLCNATGEFVVVDFQNDQSPSLQKALPRSLADAERAVVERMVALLR